MADTKKVIQKIRSKFDFPRGIATKDAVTGNTVIHTPRSGLEPMKVAAPTPEEAATLHTIVMGKDDVSDEALERYMAKEQVKNKTKELKDLGKDLGDTQAIELPDDTKKVGFAEKASKANTIVRRKLYEKMAGKLGAKTDDQDTESTAFNIVDKAAEKLGVPEDSTVGNAAKAAAVTAMEMAPLDLLDAVPVGKIASKLKSSKAVSKIISKLKK